MDFEEPKAQTFRDRVATVNQDGSRKWIYPKKPSGVWFNRRKIVTFFLLAFLFGAPYVKINGNPLLQFNFLTREFSVFGHLFWSQDLYVFALGMISIIVFISLFTVVFGRIFCGWICPQTIFMEMIFRPVEYAIEGDWKQQQRLNKRPWDIDKIIKKVSKHVIFWIISFFIANTFLAYIIGYEKLFDIITDNPSNHIGGLIAIVVFTSIFYYIFAFFREQVCTVVCPYGRLQSVLLDNKSLVVAYDYVRGEDRAKFRKNEIRADAGKGDCIDCNQCVNVCPTGIDIRNGTQLECVNCTACIDACDFMMEQVGLDKGLIRYVSAEGIEKRQSFKFTKRVMAYCAVLLFIVIGMTSMIVNQKDVEAKIFRSRGTLFQELEDGTVANLYELNLLNKTKNEYTLELKITKGLGVIEWVGEVPRLEAQKNVKGEFFIKVDRADLSKNKMDFTIGIYSDGKLLDQVKTSFIVPMF